MSPLRSIVAVGSVFLMMGCAAETAPGSDQANAPADEAQQVEGDEAKAHEETTPAVDTNGVMPAKKQITRKSGGN